MLFRSDASVVLPDAVFKLEKMQPDNSWAPVAGAEQMCIRDRRKPLYEQYAEITIDVNDLSITAAARKVADALK